MSRKPPTLVQSPKYLLEKNLDKINVANHLENERSHLLTTKTIDTLYSS